ncbi:WbqC family protein [Utexia brackfieldae]|uniref:WbqC family protein n=1 Tax=Utexia brackfieldae TaxID=3074108 RepID=UPI00370D005A
MTLAVMQPYLFPYLGYYQLAYCSDMFLFYDDVNYIKNGYINRNYILTKNGIQRFSLPINSASSFSKINSLIFNDNDKKILIAIKQSYSKSPYFSDVYPMIEDVFKSDNRNVAHLASQSIIKVFEYLNIEFKYDYTSNLNYNRSLSAKEKLYHFCKIYNSKIYVNTIGGEHLYDKNEFHEYGISLKFIMPPSIEYQQFNSDLFIPNLSMIDLLMNLSCKEIIKLLGKYNVK